MKQLLLIALLSLSFTGKSQVQIGYLAPDSTFYPTVDILKIANHIEDSTLNGVRWLSMYYWSGTIQLVGTDGKDMLVDVLDIDLTDDLRIFSGGETNCTNKCKNLACSAGCKKTVQCHCYCLGTEGDCSDNWLTYPVNLNNEVWTRVNNGSY